MRWSAWRSAVASPARAPKTTRMITSKVIACMRGSSAHALRAGDHHPRLLEDLDREDVAVAALGGAEERVRAQRVPQRLPLARGGGSGRQLHVDILTCTGARWAERATPGRRPSNLLRVMPAKGTNVSPRHRHPVGATDAKRLRPAARPTGAEPPVGARRPGLRPDLCVVGGGLIGLSVAWRAAQRGARVAVLEAGRIGGGASHVAAGMLAPVTEAEVGESGRRLLELSLDSLDRWPAFAQELRAETGIDVGLRH